MGGPKPLANESGTLHILESCARDHVIFKVIFSYSGFLLLQRRDIKQSIFSLTFFVTLQINRVSPWNELDTPCCMYQPGANKYIFFEIACKSGFVDKVWHSSYVGELWLCDFVLFEVIFSLNGSLLLQRREKSKVFSPNVLRDAANLTVIVVKWVVYPMYQPGNNEYVFFEIACKSWWFYNHIYFLLREMQHRESDELSACLFFFLLGKIRHFQQISRRVLPQTFVLCLHRTCTFDTYIPKMLLILPIFFSNFGPEIVQMQAACSEHWSKHNIVFLGWVFGADSHGPQFGQENCPGFFSDQYLIST